MTHPARNYYGQNSTSRNIRRKGRKDNPSFPSGNDLYPTQPGGERLYPTNLVASHLYPPARHGCGVSMIPIGGFRNYPKQGKQDVYETHGTTCFADGTEVVIKEFSPLPLPLPICAAPPRSKLLESIDEKTEWVKVRHISDEEYARIIEQCASNSKAFPNGGYQANKPSPSKGSSEFDPYTEVSSEYGYNEYF